MSPTKITMSLPIKSKYWRQNFNTLKCLTSQYPRTIEREVARIELTVHVADPDDLERAIRRVITLERPEDLVVEKPDQKCANDCRS